MVAFGGPLTLQCQEPSLRFSSGSEFSASALLTFWARSFFILRAVLCIAGCLAVSLVQPTQVVTTNNTFRHCLKLQKGQDFPPSGDNAVFPDIANVFPHEENGELETHWYNWTMWPNSSAQEWVLSNTASRESIQLTSLSFFLLLGFCPWMPNVPWDLLEGKINKREQGSTDSLGSPSLCEVRDPERRCVASTVLQGAGGIWPPWFLCMCPYL